jgi:hypothetical protein
MTMQARVAVCRFNAQSRSGTGNRQPTIRSVCSGCGCGYDSCSGDELAGSFSHARMAPARLHSWSRVRDDVLRWMSLCRDEPGRIIRGIAAALNRAGAGAA